MTILPFARPDEPRLTALELAFENRAMRKAVLMLSAQVRLQFWAIIVLVVLAVSGWAKALGN